MDKQTQILKEDLVRDAQGNVISATRKELTEEEDKVNERSEEVVTICEACGSYITDPGEVGPRCSVCSIRTCLDCVAKCQVCDRPLCSDHRLGFAEKGTTVCRSCKRELEEREGFKKRLKVRKEAFRERMEVERERRKKLSNNCPPSWDVPGRRTIQRLKSKLLRW